MELRWLKGNWKFGKFKLQYREYLHFNKGEERDRFGDWTDVPIANDKPKEKSLEEKFLEWTSRNNYGRENNCKVLAKIAEQHFKPT